MTLGAFARGFGNIGGYATLKMKAIAPRLSNPGTSSTRGVCAFLLAALDDLDQRPQCRHRMRAS